MTTIKIGKKEYKIDALSSYDLDIIYESYQGKKLTTLQQTFTIYLYAIKLFNDDIKMNLEEFMKSFPMVEVEEKTKELNRIIGVNFTQTKKIS